MTRNWKAKLFQICLQKCQKWLPKIARLNLLGAKALTKRKHFFYFRHHLQQWYLVLKGGEKKKEKGTKSNRSLSFILLMTKFIMLAFVPIRVTRSLAYFYSRCLFQIHPLNAEVALHAVLTISITSCPGLQFLVPQSWMTYAHTWLTQYETTPAYCTSVWQEHSLQEFLPMFFEFLFHHSQEKSNYIWTLLPSLDSQPMNIFQLKTR